MEMKNVFGLFICAILTVSCQNSGIVGSNVEYAEISTNYIVPMNVTNVENTIWRFYKSGQEPYRVRFIHLGQGDTQIRIRVDDYTIRQFRHWDCVLVSQHNNVWSIVGKTSQEICRAVQQ